MTHALNLFIWPMALVKQFWSWVCDVTSDVYCCIMWKKISYTIIITFIGIIHFWYDFCSHVLWSNSSGRFGNCCKPPSLQGALDWVSFIWLYKNILYCQWFSWYHAIMEIDSWVCYQSWLCLYHCDNFWVLLDDLVPFQLFAPQVAISRLTHWKKLIMKIWLYTKFVVSS